MSKTIITHTFLCLDCYDTTDVHVEDGQEVQPPKCEHCGSSNVEEE